MTNDRLKYECVYTGNDVCVCLTSYSANSTAVLSLFACSEANGLVFSDHCGFDGLQHYHLLPWDVSSYGKLVVSNLSNM